MGSATCRALSGRGISVIGIDRYAPPHAYGSTHGDTRITRLAIGEGRDYVPLVRRSHDLWREIERESGARLLTQTGGLVLARRANPFLVRTRALARESGIAHENLSGAALEVRFPMFAADAQTEGYYEPTAGYVRPEAAVAAQLALAQRHGVELRPGERVARWSAGAGGVTVHTTAETYHAERLVLCVGPWIEELFPEGRDLFAVHRQLLYWFPIRDGYDRLRRMPVFIWVFADETADFEHFGGFYGFPALDGPAGGIKVGTESYEGTTTPDHIQPPPSRREIDEMHRRYLAAHLPCLGSEPVRMATCFYTNTRHSRFVIDRHPEHESVLIVSACSGHGFKHSPAIGEAIAQRITRGTSELDLTPFTLSRARR